MTEAALVFRKKILILLLTGGLPLAALADATTEQATQLVKRGQWLETYQMLEPLEGERAGDPAFDFLLGISALEIGQSTRSIFALERVLIVEPNNARARAEIARAYLQAGETQAARGELENAKKLGVPPEVAATIDRLIIAVDRLADAKGHSIKGYIETQFGYDTNVNAAPSRSTVAIPGLGGMSFELSENSRSRKDSFGYLGGGLSLRQPLTKELALIAGASANQRWNSESARFNTGNLDAYAGLIWSEGRNVWSLTAQQNDLSLRSDEFRSATGATGLWQYNIDTRNQISAFVQYSSLDYPDQRARDAKRYVVGVAAAHAYRSGLTAFASLYSAQEDTQHAHFEYLGHEAIGARIGGQWAQSKETSVFASLAYEHRLYGAVDPAFMSKRRDDQYNFNLGATYLLSKEWSVTPQFTYTLNQSNFDLNTYHREALSISIRREF